MLTFRKARGQIYVHLYIIFGCRMHGIKIVRYVPFEGEDPNRGLFSRVQDHVLKNSSASTRSEQSHKVEKLCVVH